MKTGRLWSVCCSFIHILQLFRLNVALAQARFDIDRVMLQGFYRESYRHGHPNSCPEPGDKRLPRCFIPAVTCSTVIDAARGTARFTTVITSRDVSERFRIRSLNQHGH